MVLGRDDGHRISVARRLLPALLALAVFPIMVSACGWHSSGGDASPTPVTETVVTGSSTASGTSRPHAAGDGQPEFPIRAAFYYQWFPEGWRQDGTFPYTVYTPSLGHYDSGAVTTIRSHIEAMRYGNISVAITSWWGPNEKSEQLRVPALLAGAASVDPHFRIALYYEKEGIADPSVPELKHDLDYVAGKYGRNANYLRMGGRPVLFVYNANDTDCSVVDRWKAANVDDNFYLDLKVFPGWASCPVQPDGWHQYAPSESRTVVTTDSHVAGSFTISPGFAHAQSVHPSGTGHPQLDRDLNRWTQDIRAMVASRQSWQLVTSFNEWGEGTSVESAAQWATASGQGAYLDALHADGR
jgi:hypothetical protein